MTSLGPGSDPAQTASDRPSAPVSPFVTAGGQMASLIQARDWTGTPLGPADTWPRSLQTILRIMVTSRYAMWMGWGPDLIFFCNDAYVPTLGVKHPWALGRKASDVWAEIWPDIGPRAEAVMRTGIATWDEGLLLFLERSGFPEETYHTFSYSPLPDDHGAIGGMLCVVTEETDRVIGERRLATLRDLASELAAARTEPDVCTAIARSLDRNTRDLPFTMTYLFSADGATARRACTTGISTGISDHAAAPKTIDLAGSGHSWPADRIRAGEPRILMNDLSRFAALPRGAWDKPAHRAMVVPIAQLGQPEPAGMFVAALNPYRPLSEDYTGFIGLVASQIASALTNSRAYEAERERAEALAALDKAKTDFFSNISHEFRTPLTLMLGPLEEAMAERDERIAARLAMIHRNALRLLRLVNTLLDFSRIEAGRVRARFQPTDLALYTTELVSNFRSACERAGLALRVDCAACLEPVYVDADMWEQIVLNLVTNAFKYTMDGEIGVTLAPVRDAGHVELIVRDTGVGIPDHELPRIFDRFHRIEGQRGRTLEGTGIGLALVNELVRLHGGTIRVESRIDVGTTVRVHIPTGRAHLPDEHVSDDRGRSVPGSATTATFVGEALRWLPDRDVDTQADTDQLGTHAALATLGTNHARPDGGARRRILLADDNADMRDYVVRLLRQSYDVEAVNDGAAALRSAQASRPDLILSDIMMPRLDGFGLLAAVRADPALRDLPVILLSARAGEEAQAEGLDAGADDYLVKPFSSRELLARVRSNLELARLRQEAQDTLRQMNETLEQRVVAEIEQRMVVEEALRQAQKMEAIGHLTGGVAHDFNNLLTVISGGVETLQRLVRPEDFGPRQARVERAIDMVAQGAQRAATLTHRLLAFARRQALDPRPIDANKLVSGMSEILHRTLRETVSIETVLAAGLWRTIADPNQLESALLNLAVNARDAMPNGGKLTIETANAYLDDAYAALHREVVPGQYVMIAVTDTGIGMSEETQARVFEPFFTTKDVGHGTGLGLSQVYGFIKQSQGHIKLYSEPGQGTTVKLYLPRLSAENEAPQETDQAAGHLNGEGEVILVVEDDADVRAHSVETLRELGYRVLAAPTGPAGLALLERYADVRLLFTDVGLPGGMTGRQLADQARRLRPDLKVLFTTGYARNAIVHGGILDPGTQLLPKPFTFRDLATKVRTILDSD